MADVHRQTVVVIGTGYVGFPAALMLAQAGHQVIGVDIDENVVKSINERILHIDEQELSTILASPAVTSNLIAKGEPVSGDTFIVAVPTPVDPRKRIADLSAVTAAMESIVPVLRPGNLVILESTVPPLTCRDIVTPILERSGLKVGSDIHLAHCPERILPGDVLREIVENDRIIGSNSEEGRRLAAELYSSFVTGELLFCDDVTAEFAKLAENTYRDVNIALANEIGAVAETLGIDGRSVIAIANRHPRVDILNRGIGVGGHCIPVDPWFVRQVDPDNARLIGTARSVNDEMPLRIAGKIRRAVAGIVSPRILALGATYKADTDDLRESPALRIVGLLENDGYRVEVHDPISEAFRQPGKLREIAEGVDCLVILVRHAALIDELEDDREGILAAMRGDLILEF